MSTTIVDPTVHEADQRAAHAKASLRSRVELLTHTRHCFALTEVRATEAATNGRLENALPAR